MSAEVVFNEVWAEDHGTLFSSSFFLSSPPPPISSPSLLPASDTNRQTERQSSMLAGVGERAVVELIGENGSFFLLISPSIIMWSQPEHLSQHLNDSLDFLPGWCTGVGCFGVYVRRNVCVQSSRSLHVFVWSEAGQAGCVVSPGVKKAFPLIIAYHRIIILLLNTCQLH